MAAVEGEAEGEVCESEKPDVSRKLQVTIDLKMSGVQDLLKHEISVPKKGDFDLWYESYSDLTELIAATLKNEQWEESYHLFSNTTKSSIGKLEHFMEVFTHYMQSHKFTLKSGKSGADAEQVNLFKIRKAGSFLTWRPVAYTSKPDKSGAHDTVVNWADEYASIVKKISDTWGPQTWQQMPATEANVDPQTSYLWYDLEAKENVATSSQVSEIYGKVLNEFNIRQFWELLEGSPSTQVMCFTLQTFGQHQELTKDCKTIVLVAAHNLGVSQTKRMKLQIEPKFGWEGCFCKLISSANTLSNTQSCIETDEKTNDMYGSLPYRVLRFADDMQAEALIADIGDDKKRARSTKHYPLAQEISSHKLLDIHVKNEDKGPIMFLIDDKISFAIKRKHENPGQPGQTWFWKPRTRLDKIQWDLEYLRFQGEICREFELELNDNLSIVSFQTSGTVRITSGDDLKQVYEAAANSQIKSEGTRLHPTVYVECEVCGDQEVNKAFVVEVFGKSVLWVPPNPGHAVKVLDVDFDSKQDDLVVVNKKKSETIDKKLAIYRDFHLTVANTVEAKNELQFRIDVAKTKLRNNIINKEWTKSSILEKDSVSNSFVDVESLQEYIKLLFDSESKIQKLYFTANEVPVVSVPEHTYTELSDKEKIVYFEELIDPSPDLILDIKHLDNKKELFDVNFDQPWSIFVSDVINYKNTLIESVDKFAYLINNEDGDSIQYNNANALSTIVNKGDTIIIVMNAVIEEYAPLPPKNQFDDGVDEPVPFVHVMNLNLDQNEQEIDVQQHKASVNHVVTKTLTQIEDTTKKLSKLTKIVVDNDPWPIASNNIVADPGDNKQSDPNDANNCNALSYKLKLDLNYDDEMAQGQQHFVDTIKQEIAEQLNVAIECIRVDSLMPGSICTRITIDESGTKQLVKDHILSQNEFSHWFINKCIKDKNTDQLFQSKTKVFNENTAMWQCLKSIYNANGYKYNSMKQNAHSKFTAMNDANETRSLIEPLSYDQVCAIYLYTTDCLYRDVRKDIAAQGVKFADYVCELIVGINKLPMRWQPTFRGFSSSYPSVDSTFFHGYSKGNILRWDGMNSTSLQYGTAKKFASSLYGIEMTEGYHGRDIKPFSAHPDEDEIIYIVSTHFYIIDEYEKDGIKWFKVREMPFPWNSKAILWVDDNPQGNKDLIEKLEREGKMVIPRKSTQAAIDFLKFMKSVFLDNADFNKYRIITDMTRYERKDEYDENSEIICDRKAGATLVKRLRDEGYVNQVCIYTSDATHAMNECRARGCEENVIATTRTDDCYQFCQY